MRIHSLSPTHSMRAFANTAVARPDSVQEPQDAAPLETVSLTAQPREGSLVEVSHNRELRGAWIATVFNINFPSNSSLSAPQQKAELSAMLDKLDQAGFNAVFFQVRPEGDALYASDLEPWSNSLTGTQGKDPGYDPLDFLIKEAHKRNIEVHAWLNPYRAKAAAAKQVAPHMAVLHPEHVHDYGSVKWMDPGAKVVQDRLVQVCDDIARRYDVDGIHFDDYFYPYPNGKPFPDDSTWREYQRSGGTLSRADWRRENVNKAVKTVDETLEARKDHVRFGISPFGLPAPDRPEGIRGFDQYESLYADTQKWMDQGWVDYLAPQLYWQTNKRGQEYEVLVDWWNDHAKDGRAIFAGNNVQALGSSSSWTVDEFRKQVELSRKLASAGGAGNIWWHVEPILKNRSGIADVFRDELYSMPALTPVMPEAVGKTVKEPSISKEGRSVRFQHQDEAPLRGYTVYRQSEGDWKLDRIVPAQAESLELEPGTWAVAAATKHGVESKGVVVQIS